MIRASLAVGTVRNHQEEQMGNSEPARIAESKRIVVPELPASKGADGSFKPRRPFPCIKM